MMPVGETSSIPVVEAQGLTKSFGDTPVLRGVDLTIEAGTMLALLGSNGAGKTTTVRILSTLLRPEAGTATVGGHDVVHDPRGVRSVLSLTGQHTSVDGLLTGGENLVMIARLNHLGRREARRRADELLEQFDLAEAGGRQARTYSGGMRRRLDLAAGLVARPAVVFLDEPTTGLDPRARQAMWEVIRELLAAGTTILLTTQYLEEADQLADRIALIDVGRIVAEGTAPELKRQVGRERARLAVASHDLATARGALDGLGAGAVVEASAGALTVALEGPGHLRRVLDAVAEVGVEPDHVTVTQPTLDDVFMSITGRPPDPERDHDTRHDDTRHDSSGAR